MWSDAVPNLLIGLREGLEAGLIVSILVATVVRSGRRHQLLPLWIGVVGAVALSLAFGAVLTFAAADLSTTGQEAIGGVLSVIAVGFVTWMVFWMRRSARSLSADLRTKTEAALQLGGRVVVVTAFLAVAREGLEAALFLWSTTRAAGESAGPLTGALVGFVIAGALCWALYRRVLKINLSRFFTVTGAALIFVAAGVLGYGVRDLQGANLLPGGTSLAFDLSRHLDATSWYARIVEGVLNLTPAMTVLQVLAYVVYLVVVLSLFVHAVRGAPVPAKPAAPVETVETAETGRPPEPAASGDREPVVARRHRRGLALATVILLPLVATLALIAVLGQKHSRTDDAIVVADKTCAEGWKAPASGRRNFEIRNTGSQQLEIYFQSANGDANFGEIEGLAPGTSRNMAATVAPGSYRWRCVRLDGTQVFSAAQVVTGPAVAGAHGFVPVTPAELDQAVTAYRSDISGQMQVLAADVDRLDAAVARGDLAGAKPLWLAAHLQYERLGAAYGTFGDFDGLIDGRPSGLVDGVNDKDFTGCLRLEHELWQPEPGDGPAAVAAQLARDVHDLVAAFPTQETDPADLPIRAHEILENSLQFELTGQTDQGSHTNLATVRANVDGTRTVLGVLAPLLQHRNPEALANSNAGLDRLTALLDSQHRPDGSWTPLDQLSAFQRRQLNGVAGQLVEDLAPIPDALELPPSAN